MHVNKHALHKNDKPSSVSSTMHTVLSHNDLSDGNLNKRNILTHDDIMTMYEINRQSLKATLSFETDQEHKKEANLRSKFGVVHFARTRPRIIQDINDACLRQQKDY